MADIGSSKHTDNAHINGSPTKTSNTKHKDRNINHMHTNGIHNSDKRQNQDQWYNVKDKKSRLPIHDYKKSFMQLLYSPNNAIVLVGETGSGKTTQVPQWCLEYCIRKTKQAGVACTQPRRIAAMSIAERVAREMRVETGQDVGYSVRFESKTSSKTRLKYLTDGMLLREAMLDDKLKSYGIVILDEAHERTLQTEILLGVVARAYKARNDCKESGLLPLKVIIMSATINVKLFTRYFKAPLLDVHGRQHPVEVMYTEVPQADLLTSTLTCVFQVHRTCDEGDILVFCSGQDEIQSLITITKRALKQAPESMRNLLPLPLYATLPATKQMKVFEDGLNSSQKNGLTNGCSHDSDSDSPNEESHKQSASFIRRVIYSTNVAETSVTIPNIKYVIDTGKVKCRYYCPKSGLESLKVTNISKAQAKQRAGRAGRIAPGTCYRLYTKEDYDKLDDHIAPEILRCSLDGVVLQMISIGIRDIQSFEFLEKPEDIRLKAALINLLNLKAIKPTTTPDKPQQTSSTNDTHEGQVNKKRALGLEMDDKSLMTIGYDLTALGKKLCAFPLEPRLSRVLLAAHELQCLDEALSAVSLLSVETLFHIPANRQNQADAILSKFYSNEGDIITMLNVYKAFKRTLRFNKSGAQIWCVEHFIHMKNLKMARLIRKQLSDLCLNLNMNFSTCGQDTSILRKALTHGLFNNVATMFDGKYRNKSSIEVFIHPNSCLFKSRPECILYYEVVETNKCYMRNCTLIDINWIREVSTSNIDSKYKS